MLNKKKKNCFNSGSQRWLERQMKETDNVPTAKSRRTTQFAPKLRFEASSWIPQGCVACLSRGTPFPTLCNCLSLTDSIYTFYTGFFSYVVAWKSALFQKLLFFSFFISNTSRQWNGFLLYFFYLSNFHTWERKKKRNEFSKFNSEKKCVSNIEIL